MFEIFGADLKSASRAFGAKAGRYVKIVSHIYILQALMLDIIIMMVIFSRSDFTISQIPQEVSLAMFALSAFGISWALWSRKFFLAPENPIILSMPIGRTMLVFERMLGVFSISAVISVPIFLALFILSEKAEPLHYLQYAAAFVICVPIGILASSAAHSLNLGKITSWDKSKSRASSSMLGKELSFLTGESLGLAYSVAPLLAAAIFTFVIKSENPLPAIIAGTAIQSGLLALSSVGMEGRRLWLYRSAPVEGRKIAFAKGLAVISLSIPTAIAVAIFACTFGKASIEEWLFCLITAPSLALIFAANGLWIGSGMPNLDEALYGLPDSAGFLIWGLTTVVLTVFYIGVPEFAGWISFLLGASPAIAKIPVAMLLLAGAVVIFREGANSAGKYIDGIEEEEYR
ncbi:MAG: hypothetical protein PHH26_07960 [Candidatus Thermoplasmatota archaeon]|nr:hypothetical protein [Candidatus Thermoplasmatota archaeon]